MLRSLVWTGVATTVTAITTDGSTYQSAEDGVRVGSHRVNGDSVLLQITDADGVPAYALKIYNRCDGRTYHYEKESDKVPKTTEEKKSSRCVCGFFTKTFLSSSTWDEKKVESVFNRDLIAFGKDQNIMIDSTDTTTGFLQKYKASIQNQIAANEILHTMLGEKPLEKFQTTVWKWDVNVPVPPLVMDVKKYKQHENLGSQGAIIFCTDAKGDDFVLKVFDRVNDQIVGKAAEKYLKKLNNEYQSEYDFYKQLEPAQNKNVHTVIAGVSTDVDASQQDQNIFNSYFPTFDHDLAGVVNYKMSNFPRFLMRRAKYGDLMSSMNEIDAQEISVSWLLSIAQQMLNALSTLREDFILHRDIKLENFLVNSLDDNGLPTDLTLCDFGHAIDTHFITEDSMKKYGRPMTHFAVHKHELNTITSSQREALMKDERKLNTFNTRRHKGTSSYWPIELKNLNTPSITKEFFARDIWNVGLSLYMATGGVFSITNNDFDANGGYKHLAQAIFGNDRLTGTQEEKRKLFVLLWFMLNKSPIVRTEISFLQNILKDCDVNIVAKDFVAYGNAIIQNRSDDDSLSKSIASLPEDKLVEILSTSYDIPKEVDAVPLKKADSQTDITSPITERRKKIDVLAEKGTKVVISTVKSFISQHA